MSDVHPTLEAIARAIAATQDYGSETKWRDYLPEARAAVNALADEIDGAWGGPKWLRKIAAEPKPTVEDVLRQHAWQPARLGCYCGMRGPLGDHTTHQADMLHEAGLLKEDA